MASKTDEEKFAGDSIWRELSKVPAVFTLNVSKSVSFGKMKTMKNILLEEIATLEKIPVKHEQDDEELVQALDLLTWLEYKIGSKQKALEMNTKALALTNKQAAFSLGNCAHLMWCEGKIEQVRTCLDSLLRLKESDSSEENLAVVKAHQAYCYFRLGGRENLSSAKTLLAEALNINSSSYLWIWQAGVVSRRFPISDIENEQTNLRMEMENKAKDLFQRVATQSPNPRLRAFACSDLASLANARKEEPQTVKGLCDEALISYGIHPYVVLNCCKSLITTDLSRALKLLEEASTVCPNSSILRLLGKCYCHMAKRERKNPFLLEDYYNAAEASYRHAVDLGPLNLGARFDLANMLQLRSEYRKAMLEFNKLIFTGISFHETHFAPILMKAYEQAAQCQLRLCEDAGYVASLSNHVTISSLKNNAEIMLMKAMEICLNILSSEERKRYLNQPFESLLVLSGRKDTPAILHLLSRVHCLVKEKGRSLEILNQLLIYCSSDPQVIAVALKNYFDSGSCEEAYALLQMSSARFGADIFDEDLCRKVALHAAWARLLQISTGAAGIFKAQFDRYRQQNHYLREEHSAGHQALSCETDVSADKELLDVLILFDDSRDESKGESNLSNICGKLQQAMSKIFGLNVSYNVQGCCAGRSQVDVQLEEMKRAELVMVVIDKEPINEYFESLLHFLPSLMEQREDNPTPAQVLMVFTETGVKVPSQVSNFHAAPMIIKPLMASIGSFEQKCDQTEPGASRGDNTRIDDDVKKCVEDIMAFFCCLISTSWPMP
ncbi:hypothetical protein ElyMa_005267200 [Elysia marginata]|uniref:Uncharacterized protein n=1 Tax=Elysia marginata TaxID=1093978 RepID=A0AAV4K2K1_9GAST|nr:hypothetical protein ElyMa_005267200 [Elysia marginata]